MNILNIMMLRLLNLLFFFVTNYSTAILSSTAMLSRMSSAPTVTKTYNTKDADASHQYALRFTNTLCGTTTCMYPGNSCYLNIGGLLKQCTIHHITPGFITVTIQMSDNLYVDKPILMFNYSLLSEMPHPVDLIASKLVVGAHVGVKYNYEGEIYYGMILHIEPIARGVHIQFENGQCEKFTEKTFSQQSKLKGGWCFVSPFTLMCQTYGALESPNHVQMESLTDITHMIHDNNVDTTDAIDATVATQIDATDATKIDATQIEPTDIFNESTDHDDHETFDFDFLIFDENTIDEAIQNSDIMDDFMDCP